MILGLGPQEWEAVRLSLRVAFWATVLALPLGIWSAREVSRSVRAP